MLDMPLLSSITAHVYTVEQPGTTIVAINYLFQFEGPRSYPRVKSFELEIRLENSTAWAYVHLSKAFKCLPALKSLTLGSCHTITYEAIMSRTPIVPSGLSRFRLQYGEEIGVRECCEGTTGLIQQLLQDGNLREVTVVTGYEGVFYCICKFFEGAQWMTSKSILDA